MDKQEFEFYREMCQCSKCKYGCLYISDIKNLCLKTSKKHISKRWKNIWL